MGTERGGGREPGGSAGAGGEGDAAPRRSNLYTRTGDDGSTGLFSSERVGKDHARIAAYGSVDELNSCIGWCRTEAGSVHRGVDARDPGARGEGLRRGPAAIAAIDRTLESLQSRLFELGADLATPPGSRFEHRVARIGDPDVRDAERWIDEADAANEALRSFVLPGGCELASRLHMARTVARRAEREMVALSRSEPVGDAAIRFINRVSDLLFALARCANGALGVPDVPWTPRSNP